MKGTWEGVGASGEERRGGEGEVVGPRGGEGDEGGGRCEGRWAKGVKVMW